MLLLDLFIILRLLCASVWIAGVLLVTDVTVPQRKPPPVRRVLVIFPLADDETITGGGALHRLARGDCRVAWLLLTKGERDFPEEAPGRLPADPIGPWRWATWTHTSQQWRPRGPYRVR